MLFQKSYNALLRSLLKTAVFSQLCLLLVGSMLGICVMRVAHCALLMLLRALAAAPVFAHRFTSFLCSSFSTSLLIVFHRFWLIVFHFAAHRFTSFLRFSFMLIVSHRFCAHRFSFSAHRFSSFTLSSFFVSRSSFLIVFVSSFSVFRNDEAFWM